MQPPHFYLFFPPSDWALCSQALSSVMSLVFAFSSYLMPFFFFFQFSSSFGLAEAMDILVYFLPSEIISMSLEVTWWLLISELTYHDKNYAARAAGFYFELCRLLNIWPWENTLKSLRLNLPLIKWNYTWWHNAHNVFSTVPGTRWALNKYNL